MQAITENLLMLAFFNLSGSEMLLILALILLLLGGKRLPELGRGLRRAFLEFGKSIKDVAKGIDDEASDAGQSLGGIYGKPAAQALTPDNQVAELYKPRVFGVQRRSHERWRAVIWPLKQWWGWLRRLLKGFIG